ncbi:MAG: diguanylate cyclase [Alphaproteobacteria bacterium]|nr:diguanylate cyclase [Alphaproteobacteria bacterium]
MRNFLDKIRKAHARFNTLLQENPQKALTRAYIAALGIIAALVVIGHLLAVYTINVQKENTAVTFTMTDLRSQADVIVSRASAYHASQNKLDLNMLGLSLDQMKKTSLGIKGRLNGNLSAIFEEPPFRLGKMMDNFTAAADKFADTMNPDLQAQAFADLSKSAKLLDLNIDLALEKYRAEVTQHIALASEFQYMSSILVLSALLTEALFIFRPMVRRMGGYHERLLRLALMDELTGLKNRRAFMQLAGAEMSEFSRHEKPFALVLADLDKFKSVNDTYGHKVGDLVLQHYATIVLESLRGYDIIGRVGGEEFAIFLPQTTAEQAQGIINRLRKSVMETPCPYVDKEGRNQFLRYTSSFGVVAVSAKGWTLDNLLIQADECLYQAKDAGRNCVILRKLEPPALKEAPAIHIAAVAVPET